MLEPKEGRCFHCGATAMFPSNWKNDWFICDECLGLVLPLLRRKVPSAILFKSEKSVTYASAWKPFKQMPLELIRGTLDYALGNRQLEATFEPDVMLCDEAVACDPVNKLFRVRQKGGAYSPILPLSMVTRFYVQDVYRQGYKNYKHYERSEIAIETSVPYVPFVDVPFDFPKSGGAKKHNKKRMRAEADEELAELLGRSASETRRRIIPRFNDMFEFNPYSASTSDDYPETAAGIFRSPE